MNIVLITEGFPCSPSEPYLECEINYLAKYFDTVFIVHKSTLNDPYIELESNVSFIRYNNSKMKISDLFFYFKLSEIFNEIKSIKFKVLKFNFSFIKIILKFYYDAIKFSSFIKKLPDNSIYYNYWTDFPTLGCILAKKKTISRFHGYDVYFERHPFNYLPFRDKIFNNLLIASFISKDGENYTKRKFKIQNSKVNSLGLKSKNAFLPFKSNKYLHIVSCSDLIELKNIDKIISAISKIKILKVKWTHIGGGLLFDKLYKLAKINFKENITFEFTGKISNLEVIHFYKNNYVDLFLNLSSTEGIPYTFMEANSFSIPVIAPNIGGVSEIVTNENGYLLSNNPTPKYVAKMICRYYNMSFKEKNHKRLSAYNTWFEKFNAEKNYSEFAEDILSL